jgi:hypothetical protein
MKYLIFFILIITILCLILGCQYPPLYQNFGRGRVGGSKEGGKENLRRHVGGETLAKKVLKNVKNSDPERVHKYLEIKSGLKGKSSAEMIDHLAKKKNIGSADEFMERLNMGPYTFMTAPEQFEFEEKLNVL